METRVLSSTELLDVWERGSGAGSIERAAVLLGRVHAAAVEEVLRWPIGVRDARILAFRERTFGATIELLADCPRCGETAEAELAVAALLAAHQDVPDVHEVRLGQTGPRVTLRPVTSEDVLAALGESGERALLERCVVHVEGAVEGGFEAQLADALAAADPLADLGIELTCPSCGERWTATLDPPSFVWREIEAWAGRLLRDVHVLARAYGWSERDILALGPARRAAYLEMVT